MSVKNSEPPPRMAFGARPAAGKTPADDSATPPAGSQARERLGCDDVVDLAEERRRSGVDQVLAALDEELVGLAPVKTTIRQIAALLLVDSARARFGLTTVRPNLHMCFTGDPGTGKTTVALRMADLLKRLGYLERGHLVVVSREDLVGQYVGHTAPKTKEVLKRAMGGVLFIDEAYYLYRSENERDYGQESIEILLQVMETQRQDLVVILAGYKDRMDTFFQANPGMSSRIAHHIDFPGYTTEELEQIGTLMIAQAGYQLSPAARDVFREYLARRRRQPRFANARSVRNAVERARLRHASRLFDSPATHVSKDDLTRLEPGDFLASRVFQQPADTADGAMLRDSPGQSPTRVRSRGPGSA
jgi:probable Rubsico expression protein CbbX